MTKKISFQEIENNSHIIEENELFIQYTNQDIPDRYDSNYILLKFSPTLEEFKFIENMQLEYQQSLNQHHLKFSLYDNIGLYPEVLEYLDTQDYEIGMQNLYWASSQYFSISKVNTELAIRHVTDAEFEDFITINLEEDSIHGKAFYDHKKNMYPYQYQLENTEFLIAYLKNKPVGSLILIHSDRYLEVDNVLTVSEYRGNYIASALLDYVVNKRANENQKVILVADAEDTPKDMYVRMGFQYISYQISAQKLF